MADIAIFRINYKSDFILTLNSDAGWMTPFCIKFWTGAPSQAYFAGYDGETYTHCAPVDGEPTKLRVQFDDHRLPIGDLKFQISYHFTVADFPTSVEDEVLNQASVIIEVDDVPAQVMLDLNGETAPEIEFSLPAYANEAQRIANEQARIAAEQQRIANEDARIQAEETRQYNEQQRIQHEEERVSEFARLKSESEAATTAANAAATLANEKAQLADDKATLAQAAATLANEKAQLAADKSELAQAAATLANEKAALAQQKAEYAQTQGDYAKAQGDYAKAQGDTAQADHVRAEADHTTAADDHSRAEGDHTTAASDHSLAESDHTTAASDHSLAESDHTTAASDHSRAEADHTTAASDHETAASDHTRAESDHAAVEVYVDSLGAFDISSYHATGGELAKYADLTAALGTDGANIPEGIRKGGMSVKFVQSSDNNYVQWRLVSTTFSTDPNDWVAENEDFRNEVMQEVNEAIASINPIEITGDVTNAPDEHDLTSVNIDGTDVLRFKDKDYAPLIYSGLGRTYLRKNIINGVNVLTQDMLYKGEVGSRVPNTNTIFLIQYDYDLNGQTITVPEGCTLEFDGGSLKNGTLVGNGTMIKCTSNSIFDNIHIDGNWIVPSIYSEWFVDIHEENKLNELINLCNTAIHNTVYIADTEELYMVSVKANMGAGLIVNKANTEIVLRGTIKMLPNKFPKQYCVFISESNICINGGGKIIGDKDEHDYTTISGTHEYGHGIYILGRKTPTLWSDEELIYNISICNVEITNCAGDCICFGWAQKIKIDNVYLHDARRQGISGTDYAGEIYITNFKITDIHGTAPGSGIDMELDVNESYYGRNYVIENGYIADCVLGICISKNNNYAESTSGNTSIKNITLANDDEEFANCFTNGCLLFSNTKNVNVQNIVCTKENVQFFECRNSENIIVSNAIGGHIKIIGVSGSITFNNSSFSSNAANLIYDSSLIYGGSKQNLNTVFNNCNLAGDTYSLCNIINFNNKRIQFNNCKIDAGTLAVVNKNVLYFYGCNISFTNETQTGEFHDCIIKVVTESQNPIRFISSYNSTFDVTMNCPSTSDYPGSVGLPFSFSASNTVFKDNVVTIKSDLAKPLFGLFSIGSYQGHPFKDIKIINNKFIIAMDIPFKLATVYRAFIGPNSGIAVSNYGLYSNQGAKADRPNLMLVLNDRLSYPGVGTRGFKYYDTTLNKSITWNGTNWVDESNNVVTYPITFNLTNLTSTNFVTPDKESQYTFKLKAYTNYALPSSITVKMGASILTSGTDYTYDSSTGDVVILGVGGSGGVTGALTITADGVAA